MIRAASGITLERLLGHAAGIRPLTEDDEFIGLPAERLAVARLLVSEPPLFEPR